MDAQHRPLGGYDSAFSWGRLMNIYTADAAVWVGRGRDCQRCGRPLITARRAAVLCVRGIGPDGGLGAVLGLVCVRSAAVGCGVGVIAGFFTAGQVNAWLLWRGI
jgi:hypothetical protein